MSDDPAHFELLDRELCKHSTAVYWSVGDLLSDDPAHFAIISNADHYLFTKDTRRSTSTATPSTAPTPRRSVWGVARTHTAISGSPTSPTRSPTPICHRSAPSRAVCD
ncbi:hypothetical protein [Mycobacterium sp. 29Ha]|uniref:hypothetical protein n=1 Tax=Mycobacterium sp. 29Ha TaxID=2939268 RepID=UPI002938F0D5|nr:hypothetical protein [Mycobacterium sp. 29Ha]MDV3132649.1 hypothetical protein [Mycobacterium sp. 29Ha]